MTMMCDNMRDVIISDVGWLWCHACVTSQRHCWRLIGCFAGRIQYKSTQVRNSSVRRIARVNSVLQSISQATHLQDVRTQWHNVASILAIRMLLLQPYWATSSTLSSRNTVVANQMVAHGEAVLREKVWASTEGARNDSMRSCERRTCKQVPQASGKAASSFY